MHIQYDKKEIVILIHGLMRSHRSMSYLGRYLNKNGYQTYLYAYPSTKYTIKEHGIELVNFIEQLLLKDPHINLNFVTHSLGGIIAKEALSKLSEEQLKKCNRLIMLAPPNKGSLYAKVCLSISPFLAHFIKPLNELTPDPDAYVHQVGTPTYIQIGTIAGKFDIKAPPSTCQLNGQKDSIIINAEHAFIMNYTKARMVQHKIKILNIAGPRESQSSGIYAKSLEFLEKALS